MTVESERVRQPQLQAERRKAGAIDVPQDPAGSTQHRVKAPAGDEEG